MAEFTSERKVVIQAPAAAVYEYIADFPRHVEWNHQPTEMTQLTAGPVGIGSIFRTKEQTASNASWFIKIFGSLMVKLMGTTGYTEAEITALEPDSRVAWTAKAPLKKGGLFAKADWEINLEPHHESTQVVQRVHFQLLGKMGERMDPEKLAQDTGEEMAANLAHLKTIIETQPAPEKAFNQTAFA